LSSVDLPEPLRPVTATISPAAISAEACCSTAWTRAPSRKLRDSCLMLSTVESDWRTAGVKRTLEAA
jgi:hypothetical protein